MHNQAMRRPEGSDELYEADEVADLFRVSVATVRHWRRTGVLPAIKIGGIYRFRRSDIDRILQQNHVA